MQRDNFTQATKLILERRSGGRCSFPSCDVNCLLPSIEPSRAFSVGVAAHINAAIEGGPRYDSDQTRAQRRDISNGIYLCQNHSHIVDQDEQKYPSTTLHKMKERHEQQILGVATGEWLFPEIQIIKSNGISLSASSQTTITSDTIGETVEHRLLVKNSTDFKFERIGFLIQFPELVEHEPIVSGPPGFEYQLECENMNWEVSVTGGGSATIDKIQRYGSFQVVGTSLLQGEEISVLMRSTPDLIAHEKQDERIYFWVSGSVSITTGTILETKEFTAPLPYDREQRLVHHGFVHVTDSDSGQYVMLRRAY